MVTAITYWWGRFSTWERGQTLLKVGRGLFLLSILGFLAFKLTEIGLGEAWAARPTHPLFYLFFLLLYFLLPLTEMLIYRITWRYDVWRSFSAFIKKRIYNKDVLGYAGEVYFFSWARKNVDLPNGKLMETVRDNNIISSAASTLIALVLLGIFLYVGELPITDLFSNQSIGYLIGGGVLVAVLIPVALRFRKYIFSMALRTALLIFGIQCLRLILGQILQIAQWAVVMPEVKLSVWFTFAAISIILTRIPFLPNQNLVFMGVGLELSTSLGIPEAAMFSMLGVLVALDKVLNFSLFALITLREPRKPPVQAAEADPLPEVHVEVLPSEQEPEPVPLNT